MSDAADPRAGESESVVWRTMRSLREVDVGADQLLQLAPVRWSQTPVRWLMGWWEVALFGAQMLVLVLAPSTYRSSQRSVIYRQLYAATAPLLPGFIVMSALLSLVIIRIVVITAQSYGLSQYALDVLVRTLVIELLPLLVALFVALRFTMPSGAEVASLRERGELMNRWRSGGDPARDELLPRVLAGVFAVVFMVLLSGAMALLMAYVTIYGFTSWGLAAYTRDVGHVFNPAATLILCMKTFLFSLIVAILPIAPNPQYGGAALRQRDEIGQLGRLFALILLVEVLSLIGNYY